MNITRLPLASIFLLICVVALVLPSAVFASGAGETLEEEVMGYHVSLSFVDEIKTGENEVHVQIVDSQDRFVTPTEVQISVMSITGAGDQAAKSDSAHGEEPAAEHGMDTSAPSEHAVSASGHENMSGMDPDAEALPESDHTLESGSHEEIIMVTLEPERETSEYRGILNFERSGDWSLVVHFSVEGQFLEVEFPVNVAGVISRYNILAGILGLNVAIVLTAGVIKRKSRTKPL